MIGQQDTGFGGSTANPTAARGTVGPEAGGSGHVGTISADSRDAATAAVGQTTTYSTHHLGKGDPTGSIADPQSADTTTFKKPETATIGDAGVPQGSAQVAAATAFEKLPGMPGGYPSTDYQNPYKAEKLDPRVDGLPIRTKDNTSSTTATAAAGTALGATTVGSTAHQSSSTDRTTTDRTTAAPSVLTSTTNPADRSAEYTAAEGTRGTEGAATSTSQQQDAQASSFVGKALAAVGLGSAVGAGTAVASHDSRGSAVTDTPTSGSLPPASHTRKESIPTTAYPAGVNSPAPINPPVGGTREAATANEPFTTQPDHTTRNTALAGAGGAALGGAGVYAATRDSGNQEFGHTAIYGPGTSAASTQPRTTGTTAQPLGASSSQAGTGGLLSDPVYQERDATAANRDQDRDHTKRDAALAGAAGVGVVGAGAYGAHELSNKRAEEDAARHAAAAEKERQAQAKAAEKQHKEAAKEAEKAEKHHAKEMEKAEKAHEKEVAAMEKQRTKEEEEAEQRRRKAAAAAGVGGAGVAGAGAYEYEKDKGEEKEKKPGLLKRIFKRRKNKDTGDSEEYSSDEDAERNDRDDDVVVPAALGAGAAYGTWGHHDKKKDDTSNIGTAHTHDEPQTRYEEASGGAVKPSYNPLAKDPLNKDGKDHTAATATAAGGAATGAGLATTEHDREPAVGTTSSTTAPGQVTTNPTAAATAEKTLHNTDDTRERHIEPTLGLPYDPAKDPE